jgi:hypothetical protein
MPVGRPPIGPRMSVRLPVPLRSEADEWAWANREPLAELIRRAVERECARLAAEAVNREVRVSRARATREMAR